MSDDDGKYARNDSISGKQPLTRPAIVELKKSLTGGKPLTAKPMPSGATKPATSQTPASGKKSG